MTIASVCIQSVLHTTVREKEKILVVRDKQQQNQGGSCDNYCAFGANGMFKMELVGWSKRVCGSNFCVTRAVILVLTADFAVKIGGVSSASRVSFQNIMNVGIAIMSLCKWTDNVWSNQSMLRPVGRLLGLTFLCFS
ncbi:hypothetical protein SS50377_21656 [Spironucleus salmonicida]|nr:hypothetical protein SS50377_21656 [Spironucleus salmonicida]